MIREDYIRGRVQALLRFANVNGDLSSFIEEIHEGLVDIVNLLTKVGETLSLVGIFSFLPASERKKNHFKWEMRK
jgi:hypothetical protein